VDGVDELQDAYIAELRALLPELFTWWKRIAGVDRMDDPVPEEVALRWPTGISGHPRVLEVFQRYFLELDDLNEAALEQARELHEARKREEPDEEAWGVDDLPIPTGVRKPVDVLINEIEAKAPDLAKLVFGIIMIPVGLDPEEDFF
jgi:hypothetical protein